VFHAVYEATTSKAVFARIRERAEIFCASRTRPLRSSEIPSVSASANHTRHSFENAESRHRYRLFLFHLMKRLPSILFALVVGCENEVRTIDDSCADLPPNTICTHEDSSIVARCVLGVCTPYDCDICPRLPCNTLECRDEVCHQIPMPDSSACVAFQYPLADRGPVGKCLSGECVGSTGCEGLGKCPAVECVSTFCEDKLCVGLSPLPGTGCTTSDDKPGFCFNYTCSAP
jgi:hypothetical protein